MILLNQILLHACVPIPWTGDSLLQDGFQKAAAVDAPWHTEDSNFKHQMIISEARVSFSRKSLVMTWAATSEAVSLVPSNDCPTKYNLRSTTSSSKDPLNPGFLVSLAVEGKTTAMMSVC